MAELCGCGQPLHYSDPKVQADVQVLVDELGEMVTVRVPEVGAWRIPRHFIALHGIKAQDLPDSNWEKVE